ncbi:hypothetical protein [Patiriisocius sp. Uisw_017]|jgi:hypothetical protein|uniref:hypothetical protein n=1 Tax=Patiriisocius sp. Uisw_017 TaxID=3230968 RepID=UPI0039E9009A
MKPATLAQIKKELKQRSPDDIEALCLRLARFKKENKELLTYLLFEADDEEGYRQHIIESIDALFDGIANNHSYYLKKSVRKILREVKKCARYSGNKETEVLLLIYFCDKLISYSPTVIRNTTLYNIYDRQRDYIYKKIETLHEDLQYDYKLELEELPK